MQHLCVFAPALAEGRSHGRGRRVAAQVLLYATLAATIISMLDYLKVARTAVPPAGTETRAT